MPSWPLLLAWTALAVATSLAPGPDTLVVLGHAVRRGARAGLAAAAGVAAGGLWFMALCGFGLLSLLNASPLLYAVVKTAGALYLAWLGARLLLGAWRGTPPSGRAEGPPSTGRPFRQGLLTNVVNPKVAIFYVAVLPQFVGRGPDAPLLGILLIGIHYLISWAWLSLLAALVGRAGRLAVRSSALRWIEGALGALFLALAGRLALDSR